MRLGQNFLIDRNILDVIERLSELSEQDIVLEIGGGPGVLSERLAARTKFLHVVELDRSLEDNLRGVLGPFQNVELHMGDATEVDLAAFSPAPDKLVANLPYGVAATVILRTISELESIQSWVVMVQREVGERFAAAPGSDAYGVPSVLAQFECDVKVLRPVSRQVFRPVPNVDSVLLGLRRRGGQRATTAETRLVHDAFRHRRKALAKSLSLSPGAQLGVRELARAALEEMGLPADVRAERLAPSQFSDLAAEAGFVRLRALAPAKVNLSLFLGASREDGRHRLVTVFESLSLVDELELEVLDQGQSDEVICPGVEGENLAALALAGLRARGWDGPPVRITIDKRIPVAAGMAGGSADAAAALRLAMTLAPGRPEEVDIVAATLGADVPSQLVPGVALGTGAGEIVERFEPLAPHAFVILPSAFALSTPDVFQEADRLGLRRSDAQLANAYLDVVGTLAPGARLPEELIVNDLEPAAISLCPACGDALVAVRELGAEHAIVSGSGPTVVGIWWGAEAAARAATAASALRDRYPGASVARPVAAEFAAPALI